MVTYASNHKIGIYQIYYFIVISISIFFTLIPILQSVNPTTYDKQNNIIKETPSSLKSYNKECLELQQCSECSFEQLKSMSECSNTGYIKIKKCQYYDYDNVLKNESVFIEDCNSLSFKLSSTHKLMLFFIFIFAISVVVRRDQKRKIYGININKYKSIKTT